MEVIDIKNIIRKDIPLHYREEFSGMAVLNNKKSELSENKIEFSLERTPSPEGKGFVSDSSVLKFEFAARGNKPPVTLNWLENLKPENRPEWGLEELPRSGMIMIGDKASLMTGGRPNEPKLLISDEEWAHFTENMPEQTIPRVPEEALAGEGHAMAHRTSTIS